MPWIDRPTVRFAGHDGRLTARLRTTDALRYEPHAVQREPGVFEDACPTADHIIAAAGW